MTIKAAEKIPEQLPFMTYRPSESKSKNHLLTGAPDGYAVIAR